jgi:hypothetical protein
MKTHDMSKEEFEEDGDLQDFLQGKADKRAEDMMEHRIEKEIERRA